MTPKEFAQSLPHSQSGRRTSPATVSRWAIEGARALSGRRVYLKVVRVGTRILIDPADGDKFLAELVERQAVPVRETVCA